MSISLTPRQNEALRFIAGFIESKGRSPSMQDIARGLNLVSKAGVYRLVQALEERGHVRRAPRRWGFPQRFEMIAASPVSRAPDDGAPLYLVPPVSGSRQRYSAQVL